MIILNFEPLSLNIDFCIKVWYNRIGDYLCLRRPRSLRVAGFLVVCYNKITVERSDQLITKLA